MEKWNRGKFIGKGSYGTVCIGIRESDGRTFAVKSADKNSLSSVEALENEINILRSLSSTSSSSPFIVEYYGDDETTSHRNLHMEYLPKGDVAKSGGITDVDLIRSYTWCLVMALKEVHSKGVVHCDVKGSNVLVGSSYYGVVKLSDFGSAVKVKVRDSSHDQIAKIVPRGSPLWMAPEVIRGESQGFESDIWSLGCTVIEMFTGMPAWQDCGVHHTLMKIGYSNELPQYPTSLPELANDFLNKCLTRNPDERWSCDQLLQHPFLLPVVQIDDDITPRSILDWQNLEFSDDEDDDKNNDDGGGEYNDYENRSDEVSVRGRIGELATTRGVNWESDGWVEVRSVRKEIEEVSAGTSWEYSELIEGEIGNSIRVISEIQDNDYPTWINSSTENNDDRIISGVDGGVRCGYGDLCGGENETDVTKFLHKLV
ncbi:hypothetical protein BVRB_7g171850 [Beta vulgaris subsp. vulgaris]|nr:hypothetical protein BVRB_7g171850 [Beta vulgaris subsp. vulgaris]